jgi:hypothetical protein
MSLNNREFLIWKDREGGDGSPGIFKVRLGLGEIEGRDRDTEKYRDKKTKRHRDRADNKNPKQTQLVLNK